MLKKVLFLLALCFTPISCSIGYETVYVHMEPIKVKKIVKSDTIYYKLNGYVNEIGKVSIKLSPLQYNKVINNSEKDIMNTDIIVPYNIKIDYN